MTWIVAVIVRLSCAAVAPADGLRTLPVDVITHQAAPVTGSVLNAPDQVAVPVSNVSLCTQGSGGSDAESGHVAYLSSALFVGRLRTAIALLTPASAREYAAFCRSLTPAFRALELV